MGFVLVQASSKDSRAWIRTEGVIIIEIAIALKIDPLLFVSVYQYVANHLSSFKKYRRHINAINRPVSGNLTTSQFCNGNKDVNRGTELNASKLCLITLPMSTFLLHLFCQAWFFLASTLWLVLSFLPRMSFLFRILADPGCLLELDELATA